MCSDEWSEMERSSRTFFFEVYWNQICESTSKETRGSGMYEMNSPKNVYMPHNYIHISLVDAAMRELFTK